MQMLFMRCFDEFGREDHQHVDEIRSARRIMALGLGSVLYMALVCAELTQNGSQDL